MNAFDDCIVMFGRMPAPAGGSLSLIGDVTGRPSGKKAGGACGGRGCMHMAIAPAPHRGRWTAECGIALPAAASADRSVSVVHGACMVDDGPSRTCWLPPGVHMEEACYRCMRRAGATHVMGMWREAPPPRTMPRRAPGIAAAAAAAETVGPPRAVARQALRRRGRR